MGTKDVIKQYIASYAWKKLLNANSYVLKASIPSPHNCWAAAVKHTWQTRHALCEWRATGSVVHHMSNSWGTKKQSFFTQIRPCFLLLQKESSVTAKGNRGLMGGFAFLWRHEYLQFWQRIEVQRSSSSSNFESKVWLRRATTWQATITPSFVLSTAKTVQLVA